MTTSRIFPATSGPNVSASDSQAVNLGHQVNVLGSCRAVALHFWRPTLAVTGPITGGLYSLATGLLVPDTEVTFAFSEDQLGWIDAALPPDIPLDPGAYVPTARFPTEFPATSGFWDSGGAGGAGITNGLLSAPNAADALGGQGRYRYGVLGLPNSASSNYANYWVDLTITDEAPGEDGGGDVVEYIVEQGERAAHNKQLTANAVTVVRFTEDVSEIEIVNMTGTAAVYYTINREDDPTVGDPHAYLVPADIVTVRREPATSGPTVVKLISSGTPTVSVGRS